MKEKKKFLLKVPFYKQTLPTSCGPACLLMVGNFFDPQKFPLNKEKELEIHKEIRYWEGDENGEFGNVAKMIRFMRENGFKVKYFLELSPNIFIPSSNSDRGSWENYVSSFFEVLNKEKERKLEVVESCDVQLLINEVLMGKPVIAEIQWSGYITHFVVIRGVKGNIVYAIDSLRGYRRMYIKRFEEVINLGHGKNFFSLGLE